MIPAILFALIFPAMLAEAVVSARHDTALRRRGAIEPAADVYRQMQWAYPLGFLLLIVEAWLRAPDVDGVLAVGLGIFALAKALKYSAVAALGERWTFRVLVPPGAPLVAAGPYRVLRHPNYVAVLGEFVGAALIAHAAIAGPLVTLGFGLLIRRRIAVEEGALGERRQRS